MRNHLRDFLVVFAITAVTSAAIGGTALAIAYHRDVSNAKARLLQAIDLENTLLVEDTVTNTSSGTAGANAGSSTPANPPASQQMQIYRLLGVSGDLFIGRELDGQVSFTPPPWQHPSSSTTANSPPTDVASITAGRETSLRKGIESSVVTNPEPGRNLDPEKLVGANGEPVTSALRRAVRGERGIFTAIGPSSQQTLVAYAPAAQDGLGLVALRSLAPIHDRYIQAILFGGGIGATLMIISLAGFFAVGRPLIRRIREGEARFRELFETMRSGALVLRAAENGSDFMVTGFNRSAERIEDIPRQQVLDRPLSAAFPAIRQSRLFDVIQRVWRTGQPEHLPAILYETPGSPGWRESHVYKLPSGEVVTLFEDVTDRKRADEALKESEARWRSIIDNHTQAIVIVDQRHEIRFVNKAGETLFGQTAKELIGVPFGYPLVQDEMAEIEIIRPGGRLAFGEMRAIPTRWSGEDSYLLFIQDVSAHRRAEGDLRKMFLAMEQNPASVMITDVEGRIEYVNPKFTETTGYTYPEVVGKTPSFLKSGYSSPRDYQELWATISNGQVWRGEFHNRRKNGDLFWELASIAPVRDGRGKVTHYVAVKEDISDRKATEERLRRSQRMEMIGQLTGGIAHDFNNLLGIILGNLQLLEEAPGLGPEHRELIADAIWSSERGAQLTHRLLAFARRQRLNPKVTDLNHVVSEMAGLLRRTLGERIEVREDLAVHVWETMIDRGQLESALLNLVVNARDAMPTGGVLTIATETAVLPRDLEGSGEDVMPGDYVVLIVNDTGSGMPPDVLERIFEPFFTTKKFGEGSGLGLSMVYGFVRQSGGHITVDSAAGRGTRVRLFLPRATGTSESDEAARRADRPTGGEVILVVEDDPRVRKTASHILRRHGYEVVEAADASAALEVVDRLPRLDLMFTDVVLAHGMNGSELAHQVLCRRPEVRILLTSGYAQQIAVVDGLLGEGIDLLPKPYRRRDLTMKVRDLLDRQA